MMKTDCSTRLRRPAIMPSSRTGSGNYQCASSFCYMHLLASCVELVSTALVKLTCVGETLEPIENTRKYSAMFVSLSLSLSLLEEKCSSFVLHLQLMIWEILAAGVSSSDQCSIPARRFDNYFNATCNCISTWVHFVACSCKY